jgi:HAD superfamily hydrolase (TIGR01490 family)
VKTVFFDIDYTLYDGYLGTDFNLFMAKHKYASQNVIANETRLMNEFTDGVINYREAARRALQLHANCLKGRTLEEVQKMQLEFAKEQSKIFPWAYAVIEQLKNQDAIIYLVSAAPVTAIESIADALGVENYYGTQLEIQNNHYTGGLGTILNYEAKHQLIQTLVGKTVGDVHIGFGDSLGDVDMLSAMDRAFIYEPKSDELIKIAKDKGWTIVAKDTIEEIVKLL